MVTLTQGSKLIYHKKFTRENQNRIFWRKKSQCNGYKLEYMANIISKEIFSIGKGGMRKKQSSAAVLWIYYTGTWPKKILWMRYFVYVKERHAWKASVAFGATTSVELREVRQWQSISPTIRKAWAVEEEGTSLQGRQPGRVTKKVGKVISVWYSDWWNGSRRRCRSWDRESEPD
jgi:hypothetical protein